MLSETPSFESSGSFPYLGSVPSISANGSRGGIVWSIQPDALHAYDASNLASELYSASYGSYIKFSTPTIANGKVYVGTGNTLAVFGLLKSPGIGVIVNSAGNGAGAVAPGSIVSVYGTNLADGNEVSSENPLPQIMAASRVLINGLAAPLLFVGPNQINAQIPYETTAGIASVIVMRGDVASAPIPLEIQQTGPGIFVMLNQDGTLNSANHPAPPGSTVLVFATGLGPTEPSLATGARSLSDPPANAVVRVDSTIGGQAAQVLSARLAPGLVGVFKLILDVPNQPPGNYPLIIQAGGVSSNSVPITIGR
jgi:uncharacterized protein (TIGR03437 family)